MKLKHHLILSTEEKDRRLINTKTQKEQKKKEVNGWGYSRVGDKGINSNGEAISQMLKDCFFFAFYNYSPCCVTFRQQLFFLLFKSSNTVELLNNVYTTLMYKTIPQKEELPTQSSMPN